MYGKQLADTRCGMMILSLLSYVTEQLTARTGTRNRYGHCLLNLCKLDSFFGWCLIPFSPLSNSVSFTSPFSTETLSHSISFNLPAIVKTCGVFSSASSQASAFKQSSISSSLTYSALHLLSTISADAVASGSLEPSKTLSDGDGRLSPVPGGVSAKATGQCTLVFRWEVVLYEPSMVGSGPEGGCIVTLHDVVDEHFF